MYIVGDANSAIYQYTLSTAWDVSTASYASKSKDVSGQDVAPRHVVFNTDGTAMYIVGQANNTVYQYTLSTAWDVSTASYASKSVSVSRQEGTPTGLAFSDDGTAMYIVGVATDTVYQYDTSFMRVA
jgi:6-phosphogluconolactonase (cycloisomerase 2 family)